MAIRNRMRLTALVSCSALVSLALLAGVALAKTKPVDLRVVTSSGTTLAEYTQYTGGKYIAKADKRARCFGESNPSSTNSYELSGSSPLSALLDAESHDDSLAPVRLTDAFFDDFGSIGVCRIGDLTFSASGSSFWYASNDYVGAQAGANQIDTKGGDHVLWYLTNGTEPFSGPSELELKVPVRVKAGEDYTAKVVRHLSDGTTEPAEGAMVGGGAVWAATDSQGNIELNAGDAGTRRLQAQATSNDVPSNTEKICVADQLSDCPASRGEEIYGSLRADEIKGSKGDDKIKAGGGADTIDVRSGGADNVNCGTGKDVLIRARHQPGTQVSGCEKVKRRSS
jgi:Ca2+-binding RTX toxin-like protein